MPKTRGRFCFFIASGLKNRISPLFSKSITLIELIISVIIVSTVILSVYSIDTFSRNQVINSERRTKVQNELSYVLEHMSKYLQLGQGNLTSPAIEYFPPGNPGGFRVRVDFNQTPWVLSDTWIRYRFTGNNTITASCSGSSCPASFINNENLTTRVINNFSNSIPNPLPDPPVTGFYARIGDQGGSVEIVLVGRYKPAVNESFSNPQVVMRTKLICNSCSTN